MNTYKYIYTLIIRKMPKHHLYIRIHVYKN